MLKFCVICWGSGGIWLWKRGDVDREWGRPDNCSKIFQWWSCGKGILLIPVCSKMQDKGQLEEVTKKWIWLNIRLIGGGVDTSQGRLWNTWLFLEDPGWLPNGGSCGSNSDIGWEVGWTCDPYFNDLGFEVLPLRFLPFQLDEWLCFSWSTESTELWELSCSEYWAPSRQTRTQERQVPLSPVLYSSQCTQ